jgi:chromosomal replication initiation ATPase DnaA
MSVQTAFQRLVRIERLRAECIQKLNRFAPYDLHSESRFNVITPDDVLQIVSDVMAVKKIDVVSKKRARDVTTARMLVSYICRKDLKMTLDKVGRVVNRTHCSVWHEVKVVENELEFAEKTNKDHFQFKAALDQSRQLLAARDTQLV